jgi:phenylacetate-CoA ligase
MLPGALHIQSSSVSTASIGVRIDTAISVIKSFSSSFDQLILIGEPLFMKHLIETGVEESIPWKHIPLYIVVGGEWIPEGYREYIEIMTGSQRVYSNMGMAELGLNYFVENDMTILLRHILLNNKSLRNELFGDIDFCPMIFTYNENDLVVESLDDHYIVLTTTDLDRALPLIRYKSGDKGRVLSNREVIHALTSNGYSQFNMSGLMPILAHYGRGKGISNIYPETVKEIIFNNWDLASTTTANFQLCRRNSAIQLDIQLKQGVLPNSSIVNKYIKAFEHMPVLVKLYSHEGFPNKLDFERKVQYVSSSSNGNGRRREKACLPTAI